jgi:hypothetical protein
MCHAWHACLALIATDLKLRIFVPRCRMCVAVTLQEQSLCVMKYSAVQHT